MNRIKLFLQTEKGKITITVVVTILVTSAIVAPTTYFTSRPKVDGDVIKTVSFSTISSTGETLVDYAGIELNDPTDSSRWENKNTIFVETDLDLVQNVLNVEGSIGFQAKNVASQQADALGGDISFLDAQFENENADGTTTTTDYIDSKSSEYEMVSPLNVYMRVPQPVSGFFKANLMPEISASNQIEADLQLSNTIWSDQYVWSDDVEYDESTQSYFAWAQEDGYIDDIFIAFTFFNWMLVSEANAEIITQGDNYGELNYFDSNFNNPDLAVSTSIFETRVENMLINVNEEFGVGNNESDWDADSGAITLKISGTGTVDPYIQKSIDSFNNYLIPELNNGLNISWDIPKVTIELANIGSSTAWFLPNEEITFEENGAEWSLYDPTSAAEPDSFIGTQSRRSYWGEYGDQVSDMSVWGYGYSEPTEASREPGTPTVDTWNEYGEYNGNSSYENEDKEIPWDFQNEILDENEALPLGFTAARDPLVFFVETGTTFDYNGDTYTPTGISPEAALLTFGYGAEYETTWQMLYSLDMITAEIV
ncbi:MAG: hypothetical protein GQ557_00155 [Mycoplasmataceae bacterium]|nr:hypothetical protein [Mycoplasmataceae bacterium]